jgi:hypothetical protein
MIIFRWNGFEIDSSEGYYAFEKDIEVFEDGWDFLIKLLFSPLLWPTVSFTLIPLETRREKVEGYLKNKREQGLIEKFVHSYPDEAREEKEDYDFTDEIDSHLPSHIPPDYKSSISSFLDILNNLKYLVELISVNFSIVPLRSLSKEEYEKFRTWFVEQFNDKKKGSSRWTSYCRIEEKKFELLGNTELTNCWDDYEAFGGNFELNTKKSLGFRLNIPAADPSLLVYLLSTIVDSYKLKFRGNHLTVDLSPDKLKLRDR